jgi:hypothetical protein
LAVTIPSVWRVVWEWWARAGDCSCACFVGLAGREEVVVVAEEKHQTFRGAKQTIGLHDSNDAMGVET